LRQNTYIIIGDNAMAKNLYHNISEVKTQDMVELIGIHGYGKLGKAVLDLVGEGACVIDPAVEDVSGSICVHNVQDMATRPDVIIDFSVSEATEDLLRFAVDKMVPLVIATTGHTLKQQAAIKEAAMHIPIFYCANLAATMPTFLAACRMFAERMQGARIRVHEIHRAQKKDAPSGTAKMIANVLSEASGKRGWVLGPSTNDAYVGITYEREGDVVGVHCVTFDNGEESISLKHEAKDRHVFARGALKAAMFVLNNPAGLYDWEDMK